MNFASEQPLGQDPASVQGPASPGLGTTLCLHGGHNIEQQDCEPRSRSEGFSGRPLSPNKQLDDIPNPSPLLDLEECLPDTCETQCIGNSVLSSMNSRQSGNAADPTATSLESHCSVSRDSSWEEWLLTSTVDASDQDVSDNIVPPEEGDLMLWIAKLSQLNVELHQNLHSIPPLGVWQECWTNPTGPNTAQLNNEKDLAIDRTLQLSHQYIELMNHVFSCFRSTEEINGNVSATLSPLGDPPQLLVLSCYSCLIELYDKILQHIKACAEIRLQLDTSVAEAHTPITLPGLNIGSFEMAPSSSLKVVILLHIMEAMMVQVQRLVSEMTEPSYVEPRNLSGNLATKTGNNNNSISITHVSLQGIRAKEKAIVELIRAVRDLAVQCKIL